MSAIRIQHDKSNPYTVINNVPVRLETMSWGAKGLWTYLLTLPDDWKVSVAHLSTIYKGNGGGRDAVRSMLKEMIDHKLAKKIEIREKGKIISCDYEVYEHPGLFKECSPQTAKPGPALPDPANPPLLSTKSKEVRKEEERIRDAPRSLDASRSSSLLSDFKASLKEHLPEIATVPKDAEARHFDPLLQTHTPEAIRDVIRFAHTDAFWRAHVLKPAYFKAKFDRLLIASKGAASSSKSRAVLGGKILTEYNKQW